MRVFLSHGSHRARRMNRSESVSRNARIKAQKTRTVEHRKGAPPLSSKSIKGCGASLPEMLVSLATWLNRDEDFRVLAIWVARDGLLIFRPEPRCDCFLDVGESFLFVLPLGHASGQGG